MNLRDDIQRCGYFDNGFDIEHEHRVNCRRCLLERIKTIMLVNEQRLDEIGDLKTQVIEAKLAMMGAAETPQQAEVILSTGRFALRVNGVIVATEADPCRDPRITEVLWTQKNLQEAADKINALASPSSTEGLGSIQTSTVCMQTWPNQKPSTEGLRARIEQLPYETIERDFGHGPIETGPWVERSKLFALFDAERGTPAASQKEECEECGGTGRVHSHDDTCWTCASRMRAQATTRQEPEKANTRSRWQKG